MSSPSPQLRASGVSILASLVQPAPALVVEHLPRLLQLKNDAWWQVSLALVQVACGLLQQLRAAAGEDGAAAAAAAAASASAGGGGGGSGSGADANPYAPAIAQCLAILDAVLSPQQRASPLVLQAFVVAGARLIDTYAGLRPRFVDAVLGLAPAAREALLGVNAWGQFIAPPPARSGGGKGGGGGSAGAALTLPLLGASGAPIHLHGVGSTLPYGAVVAQVHACVQEASLAYLDVAHFQLLLAATGSALDASGGGGSGAATGTTLPAEFGILASYKGLRDHIFVGICDSNCCATALALLRLLILCLPSGTGEGGLDLLQAPTMQGSLFLLHCPQSGEPNPNLKEAISVFLAEIASAGVAHARAVSAFLTEWASRYPQAMAGSPLKGLLERINEQLRA